MPFNTKDDVNFAKKDMYRLKNKHAALKYRNKKKNQQENVLKRLNEVELIKN